MFCRRNSNEIKRGNQEMEFFVMPQKLSKNSKRKSKQAEGERFFLFIVSMSTVLFLLKGRIVIRKIREREATQTSQQGPKI